MKPALAKFWHKHHGLIGQLTWFGVAWCVATIIFYFRYPDNFRLANFFAEDGLVFIKNLVDHGLLHSLMQTFNGYYVWGLYVLGQLALGVNTLLYGGEFGSIPKAVALVSYAFLGFCAALPVLVLRRQLHLAYLAALVLLMAYVPMPGSDYAIIGTLGNLKFAFVYLAFMLLLVRLRLPRTSRAIVAIDVGLVLCAYTSVVTYILLPVVLLQDGLRPRDWLTRNWRAYVRGNWALWSTLGLGLILLWQVFIVATQGIPKSPGYMDQAFNTQRSVEILAARPYVFGFGYSFYESLNDGWVLLLLGAIAVLSSLRFNRANRAAFWFAVYTIAATTGLFVANRTGVSEFFFGYKAAGPIDQFFYTQNLIFDVVIALTIAALLQKVVRRDWQRAIVGAVLCLIVLSPVKLTGSYGEKVIHDPAIRPLPQELTKACAQPGGTVNINVYPVQAFILHERRTVACE